MGDGVAGQVRGLELVRALETRDFRASLSVLFVLQLALLD